MGEPPYPAEPGMKCEACWGVGKPWEGPPTPKYLSCNITGVVRGSGPACSAFPADCDPLAAVLEQDAVSPCIWEGQQESELEGIYYMFYYSLTAASSTLQVTLNGLLNVFIHTIATPCQTSFSNQNSPPACYTGGSGTIS